jgi:DNA-binding HxlR family transcriptional regulator
MKSRASAGNSCLRRSACPIANALDLLGDKWTLLVVRDLMFRGKRLYGELAQCEEGIPTNILADRLKRLEEAGLVRKDPYQDRPVRYEYSLTAGGKDLFRVIREIVRWANKHIPGTGVPPKDFGKGTALSRPIGSSRRRNRAA